jgi:hypothetical protein
MLKKLILGASMALIFVNGSVFAGQTGGDKATTGLNPQPLPPGAHHHYRSNHKHKHRHSTAYSPQWGGIRQGPSNSNNRPK